MPSQDTQFQPGNHSGREFQPGNPHRWPRGISGSAGGISTIRRRFHEAYAEALAGGGGEAELRERAQELADLAWKAARKGESWAYGEIRGQLAPLIAAAQIK